MLTFVILAAIMYLMFDMVFNIQHFGFEVGYSYLLLALLGLLGAYCLGGL